nr:hypothetical protein CFP56_23918 [Quercus suber]
MAAGDSDQTGRGEVQTWDLHHVLAVWHGRVQAVRAGRRCTIGVCETTITGGRDWRLGRNLRAEEDVRSWSAAQGRLREAKDEEIMVGNWQAFRESRFVGCGSAGRRRRWWWWTGRARGGDVSEEAAGRRLTGATGYRTTDSASLDAWMMCFARPVLGHRATRGPLRSPSVVGSRPVHQRSRLAWPGLGCSRGGRASRRQDATEPGSGFASRPDGCGGCGGRMASDWGVEAVQKR